MKRTMKSIAFIITLLTVLLVFSVSVFAEGEAITLKTENTTEGIAVSWTEIEDIYYYELYRQSNDGSEEVLLSKAQDTQFSDTTAEPGIIYGYRVVAVTTDESAATESQLSIVYRITTPEITNSYSTDTGLHLEWSSVAEAKGYYVVRRGLNEEKWTSVATCAADATAFTDTKTNPDEKYLYAVRAFADKYISAPSNQVSLSFFACPTIVSITSVESGLDIKWTPVSSASYYIVYKSLEDNKWKPYVILSSQYTSYTDKEIKDGVTYSYIVRAADSSAQLSPYDTAVSMKRIGKPVIKEALCVTNGIHLAWDRVDGCHGYAVYRKDFGKSNWTLAGTVRGEDTTSFTDSKVLNTKAYTYTVRAIWNKNLSAYDEKGVIVRFLESPQSLLCDPDTASGNVLTWKNNPAASFFVVYRKSDSGKWKPIGKTVENRFADKKADPKTTYQYTVQAYSSSIYISGYATFVSTGKILDPMDPNAKLVALTYDDGPSNTVTNGILDLLETYGGKATFFVVGENIEYNNEALTRAALMKCEIGTHTFSHIDLPTSSEELIREEIDLTDALIKKYTGQPSFVARAPGGEIDDVSGAIVNKPFFYWSIDTRDWESKDPESIIDIVKSNVEDGDIILMHDVYDTTLTASEIIIPWLVSEGYQLVTVSELLAYKGVKAQPGVTYFDGFGATEYHD